MSLCAYDDCNKEFVKRTHNQKYCSPECCRDATNANIMRTYYEKRDIRRGKQRVCAAHGCHTKLSRYNEEPVCSAHAGTKESQRSQLFAALGMT